MPAEGAWLIAFWDKYTDTEYNPLVVSETNWPWHFDRSHVAGTDGRQQLATQQMAKAQSDCSQSECNQMQAAHDLGLGLHAKQDYWAHGDFNSWLKAPNLTPVGVYEQRHYIHNYDDPSSTWWSMMWGNGHKPDDITLDASGPNGRATTDVIHWNHVMPDGIDQTGWTEFHTGSQRRSWTMADTVGYLGDFMDWVSANGCCECKKEFVGK